MKKHVLMLNTSHNDLRTILALKQMEFQITAIGNQPGLVGEKFADQYIQLDYSNKEKVLELAKRLRIDAICACCNDFGVITASYVAEQLGLPGHDTYENSLIMHHKDRFKQFAKEHGIDTPCAEYFADEEKAIEYFSKGAEYPLIVKPTDMTGGKGVSCAQDYEQAVAAVKKAFSQSRIKRIVVEPFIEGSQHACCTFIMNKKVVACCTNDEYSFVNPYRVEIDTFPADGFESVRDFLLGTAEKMAEILNLKDGILHMQYRLKNGKPYIIEAMRRVLGNLYSIPAEKLTGINLDYWEARTHCGMDCSDFPKNTVQHGFYAYKTIIANKNGHVQNIVVPDALKKYIFDEYILWNPALPISDYMSEQLGFLFFEFQSKEEMYGVMLNCYHDIYVR
jgi:biotin carboxylase